VNYVKWFIGVAGDLTSEAYVIRRIEKEGPMFKKQAEGNTKKFNDELSAGLAQCSKLEFSPAILARLELMVKAKQLGN
jgi:hypothetical protein